MISHIDVIGALIYRTREALNAKGMLGEPSDFFKGVVTNYKYYDIVFDSDDKMHLWHYVGTQQEITEAINVIGTQGKDAASLTFPCIFNYQSVYEHHGRKGLEGNVELDLDLAIAIPVDSSWTTEQRNRTAHKYILEPIYDEFMRQVRKSGWFIIPMGDGIVHDRMKVFTTGTSFHKAIKAQYGYYIDLIQLLGFKPILNVNLCEAERDTIEREAEKVTDSLTI